MKKHGLLLIMSASMLLLAACGGSSSSDSSAATSEQQTSSDKTTSEQSSEQTSSKEVADQGAADGAFSYVYSDYDERTKILGKLEKYAVENKLTGLTLYGDGGYVMYDTTVVKGSNTYVPGYGFGVLAEGELSGDLYGESNPAYKRYYHSYETDDPGKINYMNDKGSVVGDLIAYTNASYFDTQMNETKDGYDWVGDLATVNRPIAVNVDESTGYAATYRFPVKVGADLKYTTLSEKYAKYNNREVALEDYITSEALRDYLKQPIAIAGFDASKVDVIVFAKGGGVSGQAGAIWPVFGASNQLLAALCLLGVTLYLLKQRRGSLVAFIPMSFMIVMSCWGLGEMTAKGQFGMLQIISALMRGSAQLKSVCRPPHDMPATQRFFRSIF